MKKYLLLIGTMLLAVFSHAQDPAYPATPAAPLNIIAAESFIDTDPGIGNGNAISISAAVNISNAAALINVTGLSNGIHRLYIRTKSNEGFWAIANTRDFLYDSDPVYKTAPAAAQNIVAAEYFMDTDPGFGAGTPIVVTPGVDLNNVSVTVSTVGLSNGTHRLYIRSRSNEGRWSLIQVKDFIVDFDFAYHAVPAAAQNIVAAEYFFDTEPGQGNGVPVTVTAGLDLNNIATNLNTTGLSIGTHRLYFRTRSQEGYWSVTQVKDFLVDNDFSYPATPAAPQNMVAAEYFIDADPGLGLGTAISVTPGLDLNGITVPANTAGLALGVHRLYLRSKNLEGRWSLTQEQDFLVNSDVSYPPAPAAAQNVVAAEYFIDTDPGQGSASSIVVTPGTNISNVSANVNTTGLGSGAHILYVRTKSQEGRWSITNNASFFTSLMAISPDSLVFGNVPVNIPAIKNLVVTNNSASTQTINTILIAAPFSINASLPVSILAGKSDTLQVNFTPTSAIAYADSVKLQTSAGNFAVSVKGTGVTQIPSWTIEPAGGHDYGNVAISTSASAGFTIRNTGNIDITLSSVTISDPAFVPTFTAGTIIPANGTINLPVVFTPMAVNLYTGQLKIKSSTSGIDSVTTTVTGNGYAPGTAPVLQYVAAAPYSGASGVNPAAGQTGLFTYKILYKSANNRAPQTNYPKVGIDLNGDGDFADLGEGTFNMVKEGSSTDYITGVVYSYTFSHSSYTNTAGYQFFALDDNGNTATSINIAYKAGPVVTNQQLDLRIFANDISFSKTNPQPNETFTVTATITNSTAVPASNVPVKFYRDTILIGNGVIPAVNAFSSSTISQTLNFSAEGFFPIKVWIDSSNTLGESNILNNYAIRPVVVGSPNLPGGITVNTSVSIQQCPQLTALISGTAAYFGTGTATMVAGAQVTINTGTQLITTTTDANGNYSYLLTGITCGSSFTYTVSVTDFTFTSSLLTNSTALACVTNPCTVPRPQGGMSIGISTSPCSNIVGNTANMNFVVKYRSRDINNMWGLFDEIISDTLKVFRDGVLEQTILSADYSHAPGEDRVIPVSLPLSSTAPVTITGELTYTYIEYLQIPSSIYHGNYTRILATGGGTIQPELNLPDLTIQNFSQTGFTAFTFNDANIKCGPAGSHTVLVFDSIAGGPNVLMHTYTVSSIGGKLAQPLVFSDPSLTPGTHVIKIVTDDGDAVAESDETNNVFVATIVVAAPDLTVSKIKALPTDLSIGSKVNFTATVKNTGKATDSFYVRFAVNGVQAGSRKKVISLGEKSTVDVVSDVYTVTTAFNTCGETVEAFADFNTQVTESDEGNNSRQIVLAADLSPFQLANEDGSAPRPVIVRVNTSNQFYPAIRNIGERDAAGVTVRFMLNGNWIGADTITAVKAGEMFAAHASFTRMFTVPGDYIVKVTADTANTVCEADETNNEGDFHIRVVDSKPDFEVLSQYISPSSLNPNAAQNITIVGTVRNTGGKATTANVLRFLVDDIQLGADVPLNALQPGADTTVAATATYSSIIAGVKIMKIVVDPANLLVEEREDNNEATRALIVGDAPDMSRSHAGAIRFNPAGFSAGDSVTVSFSIKNNGVQAGTAWARFLIYDDANTLTAIDSLPFTLAAGDSIVVSRRMLFDTDKGTVITQIVNCSPAEFDLLNNTDTLAYSTVAHLKANTTISSSLDMVAALPDMLPGWIGGKLVLGDYDLIINGSITGFDAAHFVVTNGSGRLKFINSNAENTFPVGASISNSSFVKINNAAGTPDNFTVRVAPYVLQNGNGGDTVKAGYVNRTWFIEEQTPGGSDAAVTFFWDAVDEQSGFDRAISRAAHYTSSWQLGAAGNAVTETTGGFSKTQNGYSSFSPFTVTSVNAALPLHLLQFTVGVKENAALLNWQTADEINTSQFVIQHSLNGLQFDDAGVVAAVNTGGIHNYAFTHAPLSEGLHYYRLKMLDKDGHFTYSDTKLIRVEPIVSVLQVYPNPARSFITVKGLEASGILQVLTLDGRAVKQLMTTGSSMVIDLGGLSGGMYIVTYRNHDKLQQLKFVKQ